jgi:hypothetical protein
VLVFGGIEGVQCVVCVSSLVAGSNILVHLSTQAVTGLILKKP